LLNIFCISELTDNICSLFKVKNINSDKDPYGLRRKSLGLMKVMISNKIKLSLVDILNIRLYVVFNYIKEDDINLFLDFFKKRLATWYQKRSFAKSIVTSIIKIQCDGQKKQFNPYDIEKRLIATNEFLKEESSVQIVNLYKRITNFLVKNGIDSPKIRNDEKIFHHKKTVSESILSKEIDKIEQQISKKTCYRKYYKSLDSLSDYINKFFEQNIVLSSNKSELYFRIKILFRCKKILEYVVDMQNI